MFIIGNKKSNFIKKSYFCLLMANDHPGVIMMRQDKRCDLDKINRKILQILIENSRTPISHVAKMVKLSKAGVLKRINKLLQDQIIYGFVPLINPIAFGYQLYSISISTELSYENQDIQSVKSCPYLWSFIKLNSHHNLWIVIVAKNPQRFREIWGDIEKKLHIKDWKLSLVEDYGIEPYELLGVTSGLPSKATSHASVSLDSSEIKILNSIKTDARLSIHKISENTGISTQKVKNRLKELYDEGIIARYFTTFDIFSVGLTPYMLSLKIKDPRQQRKIVSFLHHSTHSNGILSILDEWSVMACVQFRDIQEFRIFIDDLLTRFPEIASYETALILDQIVSDSFPDGLYEELLRDSSKKDRL